MSKREKYRNAIEKILGLLGDKRLDVHQRESNIGNEQRLMKYLLETQLIISQTLLDTVEEKNDIINIPVPVTEMNNEVYDVISFATTFHYNKTYDCSPIAIAKLEKALEYRKFIQHKELEDKIERYTHEYYEHHNAWEYVSDNSHKWNYSLTVLSKESAINSSLWEKLPYVPKYRRICNEEEIHALLHLNFIENAHGEPIAIKQFNNSLVKMRKYNSHKNEWWKIYLGEEIGLKPVQFRVDDIDFKR